MNSNILFVLLFTSVALVVARAIWKGVYSYRRLKKDLEVEKLLRHNSEKELRRAKVAGDQNTEALETVFRELEELEKCIPGKEFDPTPYLRN